jgi:DNA-directed RNA polymerase sigma subunit (sigma70/sigma32)
MAQQQTSSTLSLEDRKQLFLALVDAQDGGMTVSQSRKAVAAEFGVSEQTVRQIEEEGIDAEWPPLK